MHDSSYILRVGAFGHVDTLRGEGDSVEVCNDYREELSSYHEFYVNDQNGNELPPVLVGSMTLDVGALVAQTGLGADSMFHVAGDL